MPKNLNLFEHYFAPETTIETTIEDTDEFDYSEIAIDDNESTRYIYAESKKNK